MKNSTKIEVTPEWVLENLTTTYYADGNGNMTICTDSVSDSRWIDLALDTMGVKYESSCVGYDPDPDKQYFKVQWEFKLSEIKDYCPNIYATWKLLNIRNALLN